MTAQAVPVRPIAPSIRTQLALAAFAALLLGLAWLPAAIAPAYRFPVDTDDAWANPAYTVNAGENAGAHVDTDASTLLQRLRLKYGAPRDATIAVPVLQNGSQNAVTLSATTSADPYFSYALALLQTVAILAGFLIAIRLPAVMGFALLLAVSSLDAVLVSRVFANLPDRQFVLLSASSGLVLDAFPSFAIFVFAARLPNGRPQGKQAALARVADALAVAGFLVYAYVELTRWPFRDALSHVVIVLPPVAMIVISTLVFLQNEGTQRSRIAIVLAALVVYEVTYYLSYLGGSWWNPHNPLYVLDVAVDALVLPAAVGYAAFRHQLLDLGYVLNGTVAFAITWALIVPILGVLEWALERYVHSINHVEGAFAQVAIVIVLAYAFRFLHDLADRWAGALIFRERHADERALRSFAHLAPFYTKAEPLIHDALETVKQRAHVTDATLYTASKDAYVARDTTAASAPPAVDENDPVAVALRAGGKPASLYGATTQFKGDRVYPLLLASRLHGMLVLGPRRGGEELPRDIDARVAHIAAATGNTLAAIERDDLRAELADARAAIDPRVRRRTIAQDPSEI